jgi:hypothetical protein
MATIPKLRANNLETFSLVWLDASMNKSQDYIVAQQQLRSVINRLNTFLQSEECEQHIRLISHQDRVVLIVSNQLGQRIVSRVHHLPQISSIYVHCEYNQRNTLWTCQFTKV